jgi:hypothetical protein
MSQGSGSRRSAARAVDSHAWYNGANPVDACFPA